MATKKDLAFERFMALKKPKAKRKAISAKSQITGEKPTARLKKRRAKNTEIGYFPNPIKSNHNFDMELKSAFEKLQSSVYNRKSNDIIQAYVSYAQGLIDAAIFFNYFTAAVSQKWKREIAKLVPLRFV